MTRRPDARLFDRRLTQHTQQQQIEILLAMVVSILAFFQMKIKFLTSQTFKLGQAFAQKVTERFYAFNIASVMGTLERGVFDF